MGPVWRMTPVESSWPRWMAPIDWMPLMPRSNFFTALMVGGMLCLALTASLLSVRYYFSLKELQGLQGRYYAVSRTMSSVRSLADSCVRYSQSHPDLLPILREFELAPGTNASSVAIESEVIPF